MVSSSHMYQFLHPEYLSESIANAIKALKGYEFDAVAFRGMSGALIGPPVALALGKTMILVRKPDDDSHSGMTVEGDKSAQRYIILDDFKASGRTKRTMIEEIREFAPDANCLGLLEVQYISQDTLDRCKKSKKLYELV